MPDTTNRYHELSSGQQRHVDQYINAIAAGGDTPVAQAIRELAADARSALDEALNSPGIIPPGAFSGVYYALGVMVETAVRPIGLGPPDWTWRDE